MAVVTFIFTSCSSTCPLLTAKLVSVQRDLGSDAHNVIFTAITVDPLHDNPAFGSAFYSVGVHRVLGAILLGVLTYDANLLIVTPPEEESRDGRAHRRQQSA